MQVVGVGSQDDFQESQDFLGDTGIGGVGSELTMLWEQSGNIWGLNNIRVNSAMQLFSYDLSRQSDVIFFNPKGKSIVLDAAIQEPWAPAGSPNLLG